MSKAKNIRKLMESKNYVYKFLLNKHDIKEFESSVSYRNLNTDYVEWNNGRLYRILKEDVIRVVPNDKVGIFLPTPTKSFSLEERSPCNVIDMNWKSLFEIKEKVETKRDFSII